MYVVFPYVFVALDGFVSGEKLFELSIVLEWTQQSVELLILLLLFADLLFFVGFLVRMRLVFTAFVCFQILFGVLAPGAAFVRVIQWLAKFNLF